MEERMKYEFQGLLQYDEINEVRGAFSPVHAAKAVAKEMNIKLHGLVRVINNQADNHTYDHLIIISIYGNDHIYSMFIDIGTGYIPAIQIYPDNDVVFTELYHTELAKKQYHLANLEAFKRCNENPIIELDEDMAREMFKQLHASNEWKVKPYGNIKN